MLPRHAGSAAGITSEEQSMASFSVSNASPEKTQANVMGTKIERDVIHIAGGVPGFESCTQFLLLGSAELRPFNCLQGLEGPRPSFLVIDPVLVESTFSMNLSASDYHQLEAGEGEPLLWLAIAQVGPGDNSTANLRAPIIINPRRMVGIQALPHETVYRPDHPLRMEPALAGARA
jgi:flagellar assembly factor FliW